MQEKSAMQRCFPFTYLKRYAGKSKSKRGFLSGLGRKLFGGAQDAEVQPEDEQMESEKNSRNSLLEVNPAAQIRAPRQKLLKRTHASFCQWFKENQYHLTDKELSNLRKDIPGYDAMLQRSVDMNWDPEQTYTVLAALVDTVHSAAARSRRFLDEVVWPSFWEPWTSEINQQVAACIITSVIRREVARRRIRVLRNAASTESENIQSAQWLEAKLRAEREQIRLKLCRDIAISMASEGIRRMRLPTAVLRIQCVWRGFRVRGRMVQYREWRGRRDQWLLEQHRARDARKFFRDDPYGDRARAQVERRVWGRTTFEGTGWKPDFTTAEEYVLLDYIDTPPKGNDYGVRTHKVLLPLKSEYAIKKATQDNNSWVGLPVAVKEDGPNKYRFGPEPRVKLTSHKPAPVPTFSTKYTWIPAKLLKSAIVENEDRKAEKQRMENHPSMAVSAGDSEVHETRG